MMILIVVAALAAAGRAAKLDRTYLPPASSATAGGSPGSLQTPFRSSDRSSGFLQRPFPAMSEADPSFRVPSGGYENDHQGVVVDAAAAGPRAASRPSGLGGPRPAYGSSDSRVGEAAFRGTVPARARPSPEGSLGRPSRVQYGSPSFGNSNDPDLSAFHRPSAPSRPQIQILRDPGSETIKYQNDIGIDRFEYAFETENGIKMQGNGVSADGVKTQGGYSYTGDDGRVYSVAYTADEAGFRPAGAHLPTPPPVPAAILHALRQNARDEAGGAADDGSYDARKYNTDERYTESDANGQYNEKRLNPFGERSGSDTATSGVTQNRKDNSQPSDNGRFGSFDTPTAGSFLPSKTSSFTFGTLGSDNKPNKENSFGQNGRNNQLNNNRLGSQLQYLPPVGSGQSINTYPDSDFSKGGRGSDFNVASQQKLQVPGFLEKPTSSFTGQNNYGSPVSERVTSNEKLSPPSHGTSIFGIKKNPSSPDQILNDKQNQKISESTNSPNRGVSHQSGSPLSGFQTPLDVNSETQMSLSGSIPSLISTSTPYFDIKSSKDYTSNVPVSESNNGFSQNIPDGDSKVSEQPVLSTKKPQFILTNPFENQGSSTLLNSNKNQQSSLSSLPTSTSIDDHSPISSLSLQTNTQAGFDEISPTNFEPTNAPSAQGVSFPFIVPSQSESNKFHGQTQDSDDSYVYNKPLKPFDTPFGRPHTASKNPFLTNTAQDFLISTQQQSQPEFSKYPQGSTSDFIRPTLATSYDDGNKENTYRTNGVTQASISAFPSIVPTSSSVLFTTPILSIFPQVGSTIATSAAQFISTSSGDQKYNAASQPHFGQHPLENKPQNSGAQSQVQKYNGEVYEYNKPAVELFASPQKQGIQPDKFNNTSQFGQLLNTQKLPSSHINQQSTPSRFDALTGSKLEYNTTPSQFGIKKGSSFDQQTTPPRSNALTQAGLPFGQKSTTPHLDLQTSLSVGPQITPSRFGVQTTPSFGQQTTPTRFSGFQTSSPVGPQTTLSFGTHGATLFGQKTTPSSYGIETSPSFGHQSTPPFGAQTDLAFGQQTTKAPFGAQSNTLLGQQTKPSGLGSPMGSQFGTQSAPSIFGLQSGPLFGQKTNSGHFGVPPRPTDGYQTTVSRFDEQTGTSDEQRISPLFDPNKQSGQQSLSIASQKENFANTNKINDAQNQNNKLESFNSKPLTSPQTASVSPQQTQSGGQQDFTGQQINNVTPDRLQSSNQINKQLNNNFPSNLGTQSEIQINPQSVSHFQKGKPMKPAELPEFTSKPFNSEVPQSAPSSGNNQVPSRTPGVSEIQGSFDAQNQNAQNGKVGQTTFTQENSNSKPFGSRPQSSFQSACCSGFPNRSQGLSQNPSGDRFISLPNTSFGTGDLGFGKNENQDLKEPQSGSQGSRGNSNIGSQEEPTPGNSGRGEQFGGPREQFGGPREQFGGPREQFGGPREQFGGPREQFGGPREQFGGPREQFGGPREPPRFDATGYHY